MAVVSYIEQPDSPEVREFYERVERSSRGLGVLHVFKAMAHTPELMRSWWDMMTILLTKLDLPARDRELAILRLFQIKGSAYGFAHHARIARLVGISGDEIADLSRYATSERFSERDRLVLRYTDAATELREDAPALAAELRARLGERQLIELTFCIANWNLMAHLLLPLEIELEPAAGEYLPPNWRG